MSEFDGFKLQYPQIPKSWTFAGCFEPGVGCYRIWLPDANGIMEIGYEGGDSMLVQGVESTQE